ncbi:hypothetical protein [Vibrio navarrensis]|uniref:hypothetical protein n=1 Tax=Vibrio navarrensis TaxID=29495 RepID=UPI00130212C0|nr:hypothetical protein [Vibrio navarrensis]
MNLYPEEMMAAFEKDRVRTFYAVRLEFPDKVERLHTQIGTFNHFPFDMGENYYGVGNLGGIGNVTYGDGDETMPSVTLELSSIDEATRSRILAGGYQGGKGELYLIAMDELGQIEAWVMLFDGVMDSGSLVQGSNNTIQLPLTSPDDSLEKGLNWRCTDESHQADYPGDGFYKYTKYMEDFVMYPGSKKDGIPLKEFGK